MKFSIWQKNAHKMENIDAADQRWHCTSLRYTSFMRKQQCLQCMRMDPPSNYPGEVAGSRFVATNWWCTARVLQNAVPARHLYYKMTRNNSTKTPLKRMFKNHVKKLLVHCVETRNHTFWPSTKPSKLLCIFQSAFRNHFVESFRPWKSWMLRVQLWKLERWNMNRLQFHTAKNLGETWHALQNDFPKIL